MASNKKTRTESLRIAMLILDKKSEPFTFDDVISLTMAIDGYINQGITSGTLISVLNKKINL